jgi:DNA ligase-1
MNFREFCNTADDVNDLSGNIEITNKVSDIIRDCTGESLRIVPRFVQGRIFPAYKQINLNFSTSLMRTAISEATGIDEEELKQKMAEIEDMGSLFDEYDIQNAGGQTTLTSQPLTVTEVFETFESIADESGSGSQKRKVDHVVSLISRCDSIEAKYLTRLILKNMSIGVGAGTVRKAISEAYDIEEDIVEKAIMITNDTGFVAQKASKDGSRGLEELDLEVCEIPIRPMKATKGKVTEVFEDMDVEKVMADYKYDGFRIQAHKDGDKVRLFTRRLEDVTDSLPDVVEKVSNLVDADKAILDGEVVGYESDAYENPLPYQKTQQRIRRKYDIDEMVEEIPVRPQFFDILYFEDQGLLIDTPLRDRINYLDQTINSEVQAEQRICTNVKQIQQLMSDSERVNHEGGMAKNLDSTYEPNSRGKRWIKLKPQGETIDAIVIGGEYGDGRRSDFIASFELGLRNKNTGEIESIGDVGTGFTDEEFSHLTNELESEITSQNGSDLDIRPKMVFEVEFEEVQPSPEYESGYSLRFPRFKTVRETKSVEDADTLERLKNIAENI